MNQQPGPRRRPRRDAQLNRAALVEAARDVFAERGLDAPLEQIARQAGVGIGTLYRHFPTRTDLYDELLTASMTEHLQLVEQALAMDDPWDGFCHYLVETCACEARDRGHNDMMSMRFPRAKVAEATRRRVFAAVNRLIERAQQSGQLRADVTPEDLAFVRWANSRVLAATGPVVPDAWRRHLALMLDGFRAEAAHPLPVPPLTPRQTYRAMLTLGRHVTGAD
jgi:AcrR family transcriptional regulator